MVKKLELRLICKVADIIERLSERNQNAIRTYYCLNINITVATIL